MKTRMILISQRSLLSHRAPLSILIVLVFLAIACGGTAPTAAPAATATSAPSITEDTQATVDAAIAATSTAQAGIQATIDASFAATSGAAPTPPAPGPTIEGVTMTEEELAALIDQAVNDAVTASEQASTTTTQATADDTITTDEVESVEVYVTGVEEALAYAEELIELYYLLYGDLATDTLFLLTEVEDDLDSMATSAAALAAALLEVGNSIEQGVALAEETITQLDSTAQTINADLAETQAKMQTWLTNVQTEQENRANAMLAIPPNNVPADLQATLQSALDFVDTVRNSLNDNNLSLDELSRIAQLGANTTAGLNSHGGPQLQSLSGKINEITAQLARGQVPQAQAGLKDFESLLGNLPSLPGGLPSRP